MTALDIDEVARKLKLPLAGIFARDRIHSKDLVKPIDFRVINLDSYDGPGTHWVCLITYTARASRKAYYYDSYGVVPPVEVEQFLNPRPLARARPYDIYFQRDQLQHNSNLCGWFVLKFAYDIYNINSRKGKALTGIANPDRATNPRLVSEKQVRAFKRRVSNASADYLLA